jgi:lipid II:glycine glycyltransferase (peptidoglycan interpeptide bridge formation enzyme)
MTNKEQYIQLCERRPVQLFAQPWWLDAVCDSWDVALVKKGDNIIGAWPYPIEKKLGVLLLRTPLLTPYLGPQVFPPHDLKESNADSFEHETVAALMAQLPQAGFWHLSLQPGMKQAGIFKKYGLHSLVQQTFLIDLATDEATIFANMKDTMRRNIRAAEGEITIESDPKLLTELYAFQKHTLGKKGSALPYNVAYLQRIMDTCLAHNAGTIWVARDKAGTIQAMVWQVWDARCSYYFMGGQNPDGNSYKAMSLLLWHTIREAKKKGNTTFDLEGSMDEGVERFFRNFGGTRALYIILNKNTSPIWKLKQAVAG